MATADVDWDAVFDTAPPAPAERPRKRLPDVSARARARLVHECARMRETRQWDAAQPGHLVALYCWCHEHVYGAPPGELQQGSTWWLAQQAARRQVQQEFREDVVAAVDFVRWVWQREKGREAKRRRDGTGGDFRIGWRLQFGPTLLTDYRVELARRGAL